MQKISEYSTERTTLIGTDRMDISADLGGGSWQTQYLQYSTLQSNLTSAGFLSSGDVDLGYSAATRTVTNTAGDNAILSLFNTANTDAGLVIGSNGDTSKYLRGDNTWQDVVVATDVIGIADATGTYTYYSDLTTALSFATSGDTIEIFSDIEETGAVSINLKDGVKINGNGHTYTLNNSGTGNCFNAPTGTHYIRNLKVIRTGSATTSLTQNLALYATTNNTVIDVVGCVFDNQTNRTFATSSLNIEIKGGSWYCGNLQAVVNTGSGTLENAYVEDSATNGTTSGAAVYGNILVTNCKIRQIGNGYGFYGVGGGVIENSNVYSAGSTGVNSATVRHTTVLSDGLYGTESCTLYHSHVTSTANQGCRTGSVYNSFVYSSANVAGNLNGGNAYNSYFYSLTTRGLNLNANGKAYKCTIISGGGNAYLLSSAATVNLNNCVIETLWNSASGHAIQCNAAGLRVLNCSIRVANSSAYCINGSSSSYANNVFEGATTAVNSTQVITNTSDSQGNILR